MSEAIRHGEIFLALSEPPSAAREAHAQTVVRDLIAALRALSSAPPGEKGDIPVATLSDGVHVLTSADLETIKHDSYREGRTNAISDMREENPHEGCFCPHCNPQLGEKGERIPSGPTEEMVEAGNAAARRWLCVIDGLNSSESRKMVAEIIADALAASPPPAKAEDGMRDVECHGLDTPERVCFYEQDFYVLSNFSAFNLRWNGHIFPTLEHAYHWEKFNVPAEFRRGYHGQVQSLIKSAPSAHEAFKIAQEGEWRPYRRQDWDAVKVGIMGALIRAKAEQHEYVRRKLLATGDRELVENSWRDDFWGWGPNRDGKNMLGKLWMALRAALAKEGT